MNVKTAEYKKGVREIVSRAQAVNPHIGNYVAHRQTGADHFEITLSNGTLTLPRQVAYSQQEFPARVTHEWVAEIASTFEESAAEARKHPGLIERFMSKFR